MILKAVFFFRDSKSTSAVFGRDQVHPIYILPDDCRNNIPLFSCFPFHLIPVINLFQEHTQE